MIKLIKKILGIDRLEKVVEYLVNSRDGERNTMIAILKLLEISPEKFVEFITFNPHAIIEYNKKLSKLINEKLTEEK